MKRTIVLCLGLVAFLGMASTSYAVEYVRICSLYGEGFHYIGGTDVCINDFTGDSRQQTPNGTWRTFLPYPEGKWVKNLQPECSPGKLVQIGNFKSTDFSLNAFDKKQTLPVSLSLKSGEMITEVIMSGGFYDPRLPSIRAGVNGAPTAAQSIGLFTTGLCLRSIDPSVLEASGNSFYNPPYGDGSLPIGCISNSRIVNMPLSYAITATASYPNVDIYFNGSQPLIAGPYVYGSQLVVTTDIGPSGADVLTYFDAASQTSKPLSGTVSVSVCVQ